MFSTREDRNFADYVAYLYYRLHNRLTYLAHDIWQLARYIVTGAP